MHSVFSRIGFIKTSQLALLISGVLLLSSGCEQTPEVYEGVVAVNGAPLKALGPPGVFLSFIPEAASESDSPHVVKVDVSGRFRMLQAEPGDYRVVVSDFPGFPNRKFLRSKYSSNESPLRLEVKANTPIRLEINTK